MSDMSEKAFKKKKKCVQPSGGGLGEKGSRKANPLGGKILNKLGWPPGSQPCTEIYIHQILQTRESVNH